MSYKTIKEKAQQRDHKVYRDSFDPKPEYFNNTFCPACEERKAKEEMVWDFLKNNFIQKTYTIDQFLEFYEKSTDFLDKRGVSEEIIRYVWNQYINHLAKSKANNT